MGSPKAHGRERRGEGLPGRGVSSQRWQLFSAATAAPSHTAYLDPCQPYRAGGELPASSTQHTDSGQGPKLRKGGKKGARSSFQKNKKFRGKLLRSSRQSADGSWQIPQHTVTSKMASCKLFLPRASTRSQEPSPRPRDVSPPPHALPRGCTSSRG